MLFKRLILAVLCLVGGTIGCGSPLHVQTAPAAGALATTAGQITSPDVIEASGLAASLTQPDLLWIINDGGNPPVLHAVDTSGSHMGAVRVDGVQNRDWEDLAAFRLQGIPYLLIADIGDNAGAQESCYLYIVEEPQPDESGILPQVVRPRGTIRFRYPEGPRDAEAVAVMPDLNRIYLMTKRTQPPVLYRIDLVPSGGRSFVLAERVSEIRTIPPPELSALTSNPKLAVLGSQPTAMDFSPDGKSALVLTYREAYLFSKKPWDTWKNAFSKPPQPLGLPALVQAEAACFSADGRSVFVTSEKLPAPLVRIDLHAGR